MKKSAFLQESFHSTLQSIGCSLKWTYWCRGNEHNEHNTDMIKKCSLCKKKPNWSLLNPSNKMCCPSRKVYRKTIAISLPVLLVTSWNETPSIFTIHSDMYPSNSWIPSLSLSISRYWELVFTYGYSKFSKSINPWIDMLLEKSHSLNAINIFKHPMCP